MILTWYLAIGAALASLAFRLLRGMAEFEAIPPNKKLIVWVIFLAMWPPCLALILIPEKR